MKVLKSGPLPLKSYPKFSKMEKTYIIKSVTRKGQNTPKSDFSRPNPPDMRVEHKTCSVICGTPVHLYKPFWTKKIDQVGRGGQKRSKYGPEWASLVYIFGFGAF